MALGDTVLNTPVIGVTSPFSEIFPALDSASNCAGRESRKRHKKKRKTRTSLRERNASHKRRLSSDDSDSDIDTKRQATKSNSPESPKATMSNSPELDPKELLSLQIQKAMIADEDGDRPIHIAVAQENIALVKKLCYLMKTAGASLDLMNHLRQTPLHVALIVGSGEAAEALLRQGASLTREDRHGRNAVQLAVKYYREGTFSAVLNHRPPVSALNSLDFEGLTALHYAVKRRNAAAVRGLYEAGANINSADGKSGRTCLAHAILENDEEMVALLLQCQACLERLDYSGQNAMDLALQAGSKKVISLLEKVSPNLQTYKFESAYERKTCTKKRNQHLKVYRCA